jgi:hypothetical protein
VGSTSIVTVKKLGITHVYVPNILPTMLINCEGKEEGHDLEGGGTGLVRLAHKQG